MLQAIGRSARVKFEQPYLWCCVFERCHCLLSMGRIIIALSLQVLLLSLSVQTGKSIKCYNCSSQQNNKCEDPIKGGLVPTECTKSSIDFSAHIEIFRPLKIKFACQEKQISDQSGNKYTVRDCTIAKSESVDPCAMADSVSKLTNGNEKVDFCRTCETDMCNGGSHFCFTIMSVFVVPCFAIIILLWIGV